MSLSSQTSTTLMEQDGEGLGLGQQEFPANLTAKQEENQRMILAYSGQKCAVLLSTRRDRVGSCLRMLLASSTWHSTTSLLTWRPKATPRGACLFQLAPKTLPIAVIESGLWPTPTASENVDSGTNFKALARVDKGGRILRRIATLTLEGKIPDQRMWPAPQAQNFKTRGNERSNEMGLLGAVKMWPTPSSHDNRDRGNLRMPAIKRRMEKGKQLMLSMVVSEENGSLNPQWVCWLMGFPMSFLEEAGGTSSPPSQGSPTGLKTEG